MLQIYYLNKEYNIKLIEDSFENSSPNSCWKVVDKTKTI